jgi:hypothetical protein
LASACRSTVAKTEAAIALALKPFYVYQQAPVSTIANNCCVIAQIHKDSSDWRMKRTVYDKAKALLPMLKKYNV